MWGQLVSDWTWARQWPLKAGTPPSSVNQWRSVCGSSPASFVATVRPSVLSNTDGKSSLTGIDYHPTQDASLRRWSEPPHDLPPLIGTLMSDLKLKGTRKDPDAETSDRSSCCCGGFRRKLIVIPFRVYNLFITCLQPVYNLSVTLLPLLKTLNLNESFPVQGWIKWIHRFIYWKFVVVHLASSRCLWTQICSSDGWMHGDQTDRSQKLHFLGRRVNGVKQLRGKK